MSESAGPSKMDPARIERVDPGVAGKMRSSMKIVNVRQCIEELGKSLTLMHASVHSFRIYNYF